MIVAISGSRRIKYGFGKTTVPRNLVYNMCKDFYLSTTWDVERLIFGDAQGVDNGAKYFAQEYEIPYTEYPAKWEEYGKSAGIRRNKKMAKRADALFAIRFQKSRGTSHMITAMEEREKPVLFADIETTITWGKDGERKSSVTV